MASSDTEPITSSWTINLMWTGATTLSIFGGILLGAFLNEILWTPPQMTFIGILIDNPVQRAFIIGLSIGVINGLLGRFVLQRYAAEWKGWIPATMLAWSVAVTVSVGFEVFRRESGINQVLGGLIVGLTQWIVLRPHLPKAYWWIIASAIGSFAILSWIPLGYTFLMMLESYVAFIVAGLPMGILTGATLSWLLTLSWLEE